MTGVVRSQICVQRHQCAAIVAGIKAGFEKLEIVAAVNCDSAFFRSVFDEPAFAALKRETLLFEETLRCDFRQFDATTSLP